MKIHNISLCLIFLFLLANSYSQDFTLTKTGLEFDGRQLIISYNIKSGSINDRFFVWLDIEKVNGEIIKPKALFGDIGENVKSGSEKKIIWIPEQDSIFLNENIIVEVKAEKYTKTYNKGPTLFRSMIFPGWGQSKINNKKSWILAGVVIYGVATGGLVTNNRSHNTYDTYKTEEDFLKRNDLFETSQKELKLSRTLIFSAVTAWTVNIFWVVLTPNVHKPLQHTRIYLDQTPGFHGKSLLLTLHYDF